VTAALPTGWQNWPEDQLTQLLTGLQTLAQERDAGKGPWLCDRETCDGKPHKGRMNPHSRSDQRAPANELWDNWVLLAGRGFGKTRTGAEWAIQQARTQERGALVGATAADTRDIMVEGESGILACAPVTFRPVYEPSKRRLTFPNGSTATCYSADEPDRLRGPQHHWAWLDELAAWRRLQYAWDMLQMGMRLGDHPRTCITTTPRPLALIKELIKSERSAITRGSTYDNLHNLAPTFQRAVLDRYAGTTLGRQELDAEILDDLPGALVRRSWIDAGRVREAPDTDMRVVAVDPAGTGKGDEAGIVVVGRGTADGHAYVLADLSGMHTARQTGLIAWRALYEHDADFLVYEDNFGKQWLRDGLIDAYADHHRLSAGERDSVKTNEESTPYKMLRKVTAQHGKKLRAQPVAMRYEQGKVHHVDTLPELEDQLCEWNPDEDSDSPDRVDALVHGVTYLLKREKGTATLASPHQMGLGRASGIHPIARLRRGA
jgi:phage terminase large subunit-like protein